MCTAAANTCPSLPGLQPFGWSIPQSALHDRQRNGIRAKEPSNFIKFPNREATLPTLNTLLKLQVIPIPGLVQHRIVWRLTSARGDLFVRRATRILITLGSVSFVIIPCFRFRYITFSFTIQHLMTQNNSSQFREPFLPVRGFPSELLATH